MLCIRNEEEQNYVFSLIRNGNQNVWLGLNDVASEGTFVCQGGMTSTYTNWNDGEPNNSELEFSSWHWRRLRDYVH